MKVIEDLSDDEEPAVKEKTKPIMNKPAPIIIKKVDPYEAFKLKFKII